MKRISCLLLSLLLALLCACGDTNAPALPDQTEPDGQETPSVPAVCSLYYDYAELEIIAPTNSKLPLAAGDACTQRHRDHRRSAGCRGRRRVNTCAPPPSRAAAFCCPITSFLVDLSSLSQESCYVKPKISSFLL